MAVRPLKRCSSGRVMLRLRSVVAVALSAAAVPTTQTAAGGSASSAAPRAAAVAAPRNLSLAVDANGDGLISLEEVQAWSVAQFGAAAAGAEAEPLAPRLLQQVDDAGSAGCPCIDPWSDTDALVAASSCREFTDRIGSGCTPADYGALRCDTWDAGLPPACGDHGGDTVFEPEPWCAASFCYIDPANCDRPFDRSAYTWATPASHAPADELHYSYETCGNLNSYAESRHYEQLNGMNLRIAFPGDSGAGYTLYTIQHGGDTGKKDGSVWGFMKEVLKAGNVSWTSQEISHASRSRFNSSYSACVHDVALGELDLCIGPFWMTPERLLMAPYTMPLFNDNFQLIERRELDNYDGSGVLYVFRQLADNLHMPFRPFTPIAWAFILTTTVFMSTVMARIQQMPTTTTTRDGGEPGGGRKTTFVGNGFDRISAELQATTSMPMSRMSVDRVVNKAAAKFRASITPPETKCKPQQDSLKEDFDQARLVQQHKQKKKLVVQALKQEKSRKEKKEGEEAWGAFLASAGDDLMQSSFYGFVGLMTGSPEHDNHAGGCAGRLVTVCFAFFTLIIYASFTASTAAILLTAPSSAPMNMNRLQADSSKTLCVRAAVRKDFMAWRPEFEPHRIKDSDSGEELLSMLGRGECDAALVIEDLYAGNSDTEPYCDVHVVENTSMSIPNAMPVPAPVSREVEDPISYLIAKHKVKGDYERQRTNHRETHSLAKLGDGNWMDFYDQKPMVCKKEMERWLDVGDKKGDGMIGASDLSLPIVISLLGSIIGLLVDSCSKCGTPARCRKEIEKSTTNAAVLGATEKKVEGLLQRTKSAQRRAAKHAVRKKMVDEHNFTVRDLKTLLPKAPAMVELEQPVPQERFGRSKTGSWVPIEPEPEPEPEMERKLSKVSSMDGEEDEDEDEGEEEEADEEEEEEEQQEPEPEHRRDEPEPEPEPEPVAELPEPDQEDAGGLALIQHPVHHQSTDQEHEGELVRTATPGGTVEEV